VNPENHHYNDCYFSSVNGFDESRYVFIEGNHLPDRIMREGPLHIGETGFGTGLNLLCLLDCIQNGESQISHLSFSSLEKYPLPPDRIKELLSPFISRLGENLNIYLKYWTAFYKDLFPGWNHCSWEFPRVNVDFTLYFGDALDWCNENMPVDVDAWFLDGHSPEKNPEIWALEVMNSIYDKTALNGTLSSFTASGRVKRPLREAGFAIKRKKGFGMKRHMIQGIKIQKSGN